MKRPSLRGLVKPFRRDSLKTRLRTDCFRFVVQYLTVHYGVVGSHFVRELLKNAEEEVAKGSMSVMWRLDDLDPRMYFRVNFTRQVIEILDRATDDNFGLDASDVFDYIVREYGGQATEIEISPAGVSIDTTSGYVIQIPTLALVFSGVTVPDKEQSDFQNRILRSIRVMLWHVTNGAIVFSEDDLYHTPHVIATRVGYRWTVTERVNIATVSSE